MSMKAKLAAANEAYQKGRQSGTTPPDGDLYLQLVKAEVGESATSGSLFIRREHLICDGDLEGEQFSDFLSITKAEGAPSPAAWRIDRWIEEMGYEAINDLGEELQPILDDLNTRQPYYYATVRSTNNGGRMFTNVENCVLVEQDTDQSDTSEVEQEEVDPEEIADTDPEDDGGYAQLFNIAVANGLEGVEDGMSFDDLLAQCQTVEWPVENFDTPEEIEFMKAMGMSIMYPAPKKAAAPKAAAKAAPKAAAAKPAAKAVAAPKPAAKVAAPKAPGRPAAKAVAAPVRRK